MRIILRDNLKSYLLILYWSAPILYFYIFGANKYNKNIIYEKNSKNINT